MPNAGGLLTKLGGGLGALGAGVTVAGALWGYKDARKRGDDPGRAAVKGIGSVLGGAGGSIGGGFAGGLFGAGAGAVPGAVAGGVSGSLAGEKAAGRLYDAFVPQELGASGEGAGVGLVQLSAQRAGAKMGTKAAGGKRSEQPPIQVAGNYASELEGLRINQQVAQQALNNQRELGLRGIGSQERMGLASLDTEKTLGLAEIAAGRFGIDRTSRRDENIAGTMARRDMSIAGTMAQRDVAISGLETGRDKYVMGSGNFRAQKEAETVQYVQGSGNLKARLQADAAKYIEGSGNLKAQLQADAAKYIQGSGNYIQGSGNLKTQMQAQVENNRTFAGRYKTQVDNETERRRISSQEKLGLAQLGTQERVSGRGFDRDIYLGQLGAKTQDKGIEAQKAIAQLNANTQLNLGQMQSRAEGRRRLDDVYTSAFAAFRSFY